MLGEAAASDVSRLRLLNVRREEGRQADPDGNKRGKVGERDRYHEAQASLSGFLVKTWPMIRGCNANKTYHVMI